MINIFFSLSLYAYALHAKMKLKTVLRVSGTEKYTDNVRDLFSPAFTRDIRSGLGTKICL